MSGQSAHLTRKESIALQKKVECGGKVTHGSSSNSGHGTESHGKSESPKAK